MKQETIRTIILEQEKTRACPDNTLIYQIDERCTNENIEEVIKITNTVWQYATDEFSTEKMIDIKEKFNIDVERYEVNEIVDEDWNEIFKTTMSIKSHQIFKEIRSFTTFNI